MIEEFLLLFSFCLEIRLVLNLTKYSLSKVDSIFLADLGPERGYPNSNTFHSISAALPTVSCQPSFHILKQYFPRQEKHPTSMPHRCPFKPGTSPSNARIHHFQYENATVNGSITYATVSWFFLLQSVLNTTN